MPGFRISTRMGADVCKAKQNTHGDKTGRQYRRTHSEERKRIFGVPWSGLSVSTWKSTAITVCFAMAVFICVLYALS